MDDPLAQNPTGNHTGTYHWHYFVEYNEVARDTWGRGKFALGIGDVDSEGASRNLTTEYWDVWNLGATRPDAHVAWTGKHEDCLHVSPTDLGAKLVINFRIFIVVPCQHLPMDCEGMVAYHCPGEYLNGSRPRQCITSRPELKYIS